MQNLIDLLTKKHFKDFKLITDAAELNHLPQAWQQIAAATNAGERKQIALNYWQPVAEHMPMTIGALSELLKDVIVLHDATGYKLVYIANLDGRDHLYVGYPPTAEGPFLDLMRADIAAFYKNIHNGWTEHNTGAVGFIPLNEIEFLDVHEWGILEDLPDLDLDLSKIFAVFHNGGGGYLCLDVSDEEYMKSLIFWTKDAPKLNLSFWSYMDAWVEIGMTN